jgi:hypothetical protein
MPYRHCIVHSKIYEKAIHIHIKHQNQSMNANMVEPIKAKTPTWVREAAPVCGADPVVNTPLVVVVEV